MRNENLKVIVAAWPTPASTPCLGQGRAPESHLRKKMSIKHSKSETQSDFDL